MSITYSPASSRSLCVEVDHTLVLHTCAAGSFWRLSCTKKRICGLQAKIRWLRASRLWREKFHSWTLSMRAKKRLQKETEAVAALEERRKQYQANAQQRLAWVEEGLSQRLTEDSTCPVCRSDAGQLHKACCLPHFTLLAQIQPAYACLQHCLFGTEMRTWHDCHPCRQVIFGAYAVKPWFCLMT